MSGQKVWSITGASQGFGSRKRVDDAYSLFAANLRGDERGQYCVAIGVQRMKAPMPLLWCTSASPPEFISFSTHYRAVLHARNSERVNVTRRAQPQTLGVGFGDISTNAPIAKCSCRWPSEPHGAGHPSSWQTLWNPAARRANPGQLPDYCQELTGARIEARVLR